MTMAITANDGVEKPPTRISRTEGEQLIVNKLIGKLILKSNFIYVRTIFSAVRLTGMGTEGVIQYKTIV